MLGTTEYRLSTHSQNRVDNYHGRVKSTLPTSHFREFLMSATTSLSTSGQGGYLLPTGYLSTSGNQIVDSEGNPVRIDSIGWNGTDGAAGSALQGLYGASYQTIMNAIKADGFNTIRIPWSDVSLTSMPAPGTIDYSLNPGLQGLNTLQIFQQVVAYAGQIGVKVIFDHHTDDGGPNGWGGQQANGLWFDSGSGSDGTDGSGTTGTVTAARFEQDWLTLASTFKGNSTVIGYDLDNEPTSAGNINWGQGGPTDIQAMYTTVGNAVEAADPGALIIAEGPQEYNAPGAGSGMSANVAAPEGDLTGVATDPVTLNTPNKVVYSVHEYPSTISGTSVDSGPAYIQEMNAAWGYLESQNIAPVWIGEMGASLDGTADSAGSGLANEQAWASTLLGYMNGEDDAQGGPTFTGNQQPIGGSWWLAGAESGQYPDGIQSAYGAGNYRPGQQAITDQMVFIPKPGSTGSPFPAPATASPNDTVVKANAPGGIIDASGNKWTITSDGQVAVNGVTDITTADVKELIYVNSEIWQENASNLWWGKTSPAAAWSPGTGTSKSPLSTTVIISQSQASETVSQSNISVVATSGNHLVFITGGGDTMKLSGGTNTITDTGSSNIYVVPAAGNGYDKFASNILGNGVTLDLRTALEATNWAGSASALSKYLTVADTAQGAVLSIAATAGGTAVAIATIDGATIATLSTVLAHSLT
jgi:endoglucanase